MDAPKTKGYDPRLDSLRAVSAIAIIPFHWSVMPFGWIGVPVFFVLSGMLITESLLKSKERIPDLRSFISFFFEKRMLRLFPLYYAFLLVLGILFLLIRWPVNLPAKAAYLLTYSYNLNRLFAPTAPAAGFGHLWSLGVEWQFYLIWPFLVWSLSERRLLRVALALVLLAPLLRALTIFAAETRWTDPVAIGAVVYVAPWSHWDALALGAMLAQPKIRFFFSQTHCWLAVLAMTVASGILVIYLGHGSISLRTLGYPGFLPFFYQSIWGYSLINLSSACLIALTSQGSWVTAFTAWPFLQYLGKISYGLYVIHFPLVDLCFYWMPDHHLTGTGMLLLVAIILADIALAHLSYRYFESWFLRKKATLKQNPEPSVHRKNISSSKAHFRG